jgi:hypothetical protein
MQNSFSSGEVSPTLYGRVDLDKYHTSLQICYNAIVDYRGGVTRRPGTRFVGPHRDANFGKVRLIPFTFSTVQSYALLFGNFHMRVIRNGGFVTEPAKTISRSGSTYTSTAHGFSTGDWISVSDLVPPLLVTVLNANQFTVTDVYGQPAVSNATSAARVYTLSTPWGWQDLALLKYTQSFDTMTLTHPSYAAYNLTRTQHWVWTLTAVSIGATISAPSITSITGTLTGSPPAGTTSDTGYAYMVTAVDVNGQEGPPSIISGVIYLNRDALPVSLKVVWTAVSGAVYYNVYSAIPTHNVFGGVDSFAVCGYIGFSNSTNFVDTDIQPDFTKTPPIQEFPLVGNAPGVATYFDQRKVYAASAANPQTLWMSRPAQYNNFDTSRPANDGDALTLTLATVQSSEIRALLPMPDGMLAFTQSGVFKISGGGQNAGIKVSSALARQQNYIGANDVQPIPINFEIFFVQEKGSIVRALTYNFYTSTYEPVDLTLLSNHLFTGHTIIDWAYAEHPNKIIWCVREDGVLLALTYLKDQKIQGWTRCETNGVIEAIVAIPENGSDSVYVSVLRTINNSFQRYIEQITLTDLRKGTEFGWFLDAALDYGSTYPVSTLIASSTSGAVTLSGSASIFTGGDVGKVIYAGGGKATITSYLSGQVVLGTWNRSPTDLVYDGASWVMRLQPAGAWTLSAKVTSLSGLNHLVNTAVSYLADGVPGTGTVSSTGTLTVPSSARVIVGLNYLTQCQTLDLEPGGTSMQGKRKRVISVTAKVQATGSLKWGRSFDELTPWVDVYGDKLSNSIMTGDQPLGVDQFYDYGGRICWQQNLPLPMTILSLVPEISVGD